MPELTGTQPAQLREKQEFGHGKQHHPKMPVNLSFSLSRIKSSRFPWVAPTELSSVKPRGDEEKEVKARVGHQRKTMAVPRVEVGKEEEM